MVKVVKTEPSIKLVQSVFTCEYCGKEYENNEMSAIACENKCRKEHCLHESHLYSVYTDHDDTQITADCVCSECMTVVDTVSATLLNQEVSSFIYNYLKEL